MPAAGSNELLLLAIFAAWSVMVAVSAHRRVRNMILASAGAAGVAAASFIALLFLSMGQAASEVELAVAFVVLLFVGLGLAVVTWIVMKLGGWLPRREDLDGSGR